MINVLLLRMEKFIMDIIRYNDLYKDRMNIFNSYLLFTIFVVLLSLFVSMNITYKKYFLAKAVVNNNEYLKCLVEENSLSLLNKNSTLIIDEVEYQYSISSVEPIVNENNLIYQVELKVNLDSKISKENNVLNLKILVEKQSVLKYVIRKVGEIY